MSVPEPTTARRRRIMLLLLVTVFAAPFILSWYLFHFTQLGRGDAGRSHGQLIIPPRLLPEAALDDPGRQRESGMLRHKWTLLYLVPGPCDPQCLQALLQMRQLRLALGRHGQRMQRALVIYGNFPPDLPASVLKEYPGQMIMAGSALDGDDPGRNFRLFENDDPLRAERLYLVDPMGNLMLGWPAGTDPAGIIADLMRLLKYSGAG